MSDQETPVRRVMIIDDHVLDVMKAQRALKAAGYEVVRLSTPHGALAKLEYEQPEILLVDITMKRLNPAALLEAIRAAPEYEDLIVVIFSDMDAETLQNYCMDHDVHGYYCKSMDIEKVPAFLDNFYEY